MRVTQAVLRRSTSEADHEEVLARNSNAVPSVVYSELKKIGALLSTADGGSTVLCYFAQATTVVYGLLTLLTNAHTNAGSEFLRFDSEPDALLYVAAVVYSSGFMLGSLAWSPRRAKRSASAAHWRSSRRARS